jgi:acyl-CoA synthetase (AMP-forming)/AMP-acid ligase II
LLSLIQAVTQEVSSRAEPPDLSHLIEIVYGASPIRPDLLERAVAVLGCRFRQNYASSETGPLPITSLPPEDHDPARGRLGTAGRPSLGWEVRLGERGEIQVRGAAGFKCPTGVTVVSELPRNATGKVLRAALRQPFWAGRDRLVS